VTKLLAKFNLHDSKSQPSQTFADVERQQSFQTQEKKKNVNFTSKQHRRVNHAS